MRDADTGTFAGVECGRDGWETQVAALSGDGTRIAYITWSYSTAVRYIVVHTLADGSEMRFDESDEGTDWCVAFSPDGHELAVLSSTRVKSPEYRFGEKWMIVWIIDLATGGRRKLWSGPGGLPAERQIGWSPDGHYIVIAHADTDDQLAVTILEAAHGYLVNQISDREILSCPQGAWASDQEVVLFPEEVDYNQTPVPPTLITNVVTGAIRGPENTPGLPDCTFALTHGRIVGAFTPDSLSIMSLDGSDSHTLLTFDEQVVFNLIDVAREVEIL
ncbi:WD40 repeat domain-containing protein [Streptomyces sp. NPDC020983]|uniref:WD40 repeat domain-containing protein n=1 Tax=Streptomyces sp. NPDC020983 TaxID=3365106 RepID=UPI0037B0899C